MLRINIIASSLLLICSVASAERIVCFDAVTQRVTQTIEGDCLKTGVCSDYDNKGMASNCIFATDEEWSKAHEQYVEFDGAVVSGSRIVDLRQAKIDVILSQQAAEVTAQKTTSVNNLDITIKDAFLAFLTVYNSKVPANYRITPTELKNQLKTDLGL